MAEIGFVGLGMMGMPMATCLVAAGHVVLAHDARGLVPEGGQAVTLQAVAAADTLILMLPDSAAVASVMQALLPLLQPRHLVIDMGSSLPAETRRWAAACRFIDAPVSGSVVKARAGTLAVMVGGGDAEFAQAGPVLDAMAGQLIRTGPPGSAHAMKALNNFVYAAGLLATAEALVIAGRAGLDLDVFADVLNASSGRNIATETKVKQEILSGRYAGGFQLGLMRKDLETAGAIAAEVHSNEAGLELCRRLWSEAVTALGPAADNTEMHRWLDRPQHSQVGGDAGKLEEFT